MIDTQTEKIRISEMAIRGSLSHRTNPTMSIDDIVSEIKADREVLIKNKQSKISKISEILDEDIFEIPSSWKWVALGDLCILLSRGKSPTYSEVKKYPVFAQKCNQPQSLALEKALFLDESTLEKWPEYFRLRNTDVVINSTGTGTVGRVGYYMTDTLDPQYEFMVPDSHVTVVRVGNNVVSKYIYYALRTKTIQSIMEKTYKGSTNQKEFYIDSVYSIPVPLPPTEEQKEIVDILDKVYEQLDIIDNLQQQYQSDLAVLKGKIIDAGIRGKLTEQLPEDGDAETLYAQIQEEKAKLIKEGKIKKEKPLPDIAADEIPFEIPKNWKWVRWGDLSEKIQYGYNAPAKQSGRIKMVRISDIQDGRVQWETVPFCDIDEEDIDAYLLRENDILFARTGGTVGKSYIVSEIPEEAVYAGYLIRTSYSSDIYAPYMKYFMDSALYWRQLQSGTIATAQPNCNGKTLSKMIVPLPPYAEQKRIAEKIDAILEQINS